MLRVENLSFSYDKIQAIRNVSFELQKGEIMAIVGANGAGKSSLMKCIAGLLKPQWGEVYLNDKKMESAAYRVVESGAVSYTHLAQLLKDGADGLVLALVAVDHRGGRHLLDQAHRLAVRIVHGLDDGVDVVEVVGPVAYTHLRSAETSGCRCPGPAPCVTARPPDRGSPGRCPPSGRCV